MIKLINANKRKYKIDISILSVIKPITNIITASRIAIGDIIYDIAPFINVCHITIIIKTIKA